MKITKWSDSIRNKARIKNQEKNKTTLNRTQNIFPMMIHQIQKSKLPNLTNKKHNLLRSLKIKPMIITINRQILPKLIQNNKQVREMEMDSAKKQVMLIHSNQAYNKKALWIANNQANNRILWLSYQRRKRFKIRTQIRWKKGESNN